MFKSYKNDKMTQEHRNIRVLLPNKEQLSVVIGVKAIAQELFNQVCDLVKIKEPHFFGLSIFKNNEHIFMDLEQKLSKYFPKEWKKETGKGTETLGTPFVACFTVQYYVENGRVIGDKTARHLYYCQMKEQVRKSQCVQKEEIYFLLAAYALQAELGNYKKKVHIGKYFEPQDYFPQWIQVIRHGCRIFMSHARNKHKNKILCTSEEALLKVMDGSSLKGKVLVHVFFFFHDKKEECPSIVLGLTLKGMYIYQEVNHIRQLLYDFPWSNVGKLTFLGKKFEIQPDGLPSARKLVYYTGCPFRSRHLLQLLSNSHRLYLNVQPVLKQIRKAEETEEKKRYRESYISDTLEMDLDQLDKHSHGSGSSRSSLRNNHLSRQSTVSHSSSHTSGIEADSRHRIIEQGHRTGQSYSSGISRGSSRTSGFDSGSKGRVGYDSHDDEIELAVDEPVEIPVDSPLEITQRDGLGHVKQDLLNALHHGCHSELVLYVSSASAYDPLVKLRGQSIDSLERVARSKHKTSTDRHSQSLDDVRLYQQQSPLSATISSDTSQSYTFGC
uniref:FERM domain-containing protein n=1 Tax=Latimeria chalumnae TaxID=7897 RepID=H2ZW81_LATCH